MITKTDRAKIAAYLSSAERIRITRNGEVHVYGRMPNTNTTGWYFAGFSENLLDQISEEERRAEADAKALAHLKERDELD